eukprot:m.41201 g.41201  ORF g.41201 m.41201 type:complete len:218 (+) comp12814_c0_seq4:484-1137(+)
MFRFLTLLLAVAIVAQAYDSKCCKKGHNCCKKGDTKTGERRSDCAAWLRRSVCEHATTQRPTTTRTIGPEPTCKVSLPDCTLTSDCLRANCVVKTAILPDIKLGFALNPCDHQGPTLNVYLNEGAIRFNHTFDSSADINTPIAVSIPAVGSVAIYIHVQIGDLANDELPLTLSLMYKYKLPVVGTTHKTIATIFDGEFPIDSPCALSARPLKPVKLQ